MLIIFHHVESKVATVLFGDASIIYLMNECHIMTWLTAPIFCQTVFVIQIYMNIFSH